MEILICTLLLDKQVVYLGKQIIILISELLVRIRKCSLTQIGLQTLRLHCHPCGSSSASAGG